MPLWPLHILGLSSFFQRLQENLTAPLKITFPLHEMNSFPWDISAQDHVCNILNFIIWKIWKYFHHLHCQTHQWLHLTCNVQSFSHTSISDLMQERGCSISFDLHALKGIQVCLSNFLQCWLLLVPFWALQSPLTLRSVSHKTNKKLTLFQQIAS